ncbi:unnamed protein product [Rodentolepis nana]|uniref:Pyrroline-5-carboxylate reductase 3 n=1 Tax=Rodentolepis nana TaxID=102285 RepID=A0A0R3TWY6_RODNA|nr:unnamed protein product [Rodentolepis nana]
MLAENQMIIGDRHIGFLGSGMMAQGICKGLLRTGLVNGTQVTLSDKVVQGQPMYANIEEIIKQYGVEYTTDNVLMATKSDIIFVCVKPNLVPLVLRECASVIGNKLVISIAAGVTIDSIEGCLTPGARVIRVMPNMPCLVQQGAAIFTRGHNATDADVKVAKLLLTVIMPVAEEIPEYQMNIGTALSGCGPAYVCMMIEGLADGAVRMGMSRDMAHRLAVQTVLGTAMLIRDNNVHPAVLRDQICSPGGSTIAGTFALEKAGVRAAFNECIEAAKIRNDELGAPKK